MTKKLGQDFAEFMDEANQIPKVKEYLTSFSAVFGWLAGCS
ncbi:hypothetical protein [Paenibacillus sp. TH7-28]